MKLTAALTLVLAASSALAQTDQPQYPIHTYYLKYATTQNEQNEILTAIRNLADPSIKIFLVPSQSQIVVRASPEQNERITEVLKTLDVPAPLYRLTYIFTETDNGKRIGLQQYSMVVASGQRTQLKEGDKVPVMTGSTDKDSGSVTKQTTYTNVGFDFDATVTMYGPDGVLLKTKVERSAIAQEKTSVLAEDPLIRQSTIEGTVNLTLNKPQHLGNIDVIGSSRQLQIDALVEVVK